MSYNPAHRFKPGRLFITCIDAENIRGRADNNEDTLTPHLLFKLPTTIDLPIRQSRIGAIKGYNVAFGREVVSIDIANPEQLLVNGDISLIVQLRDGLKGLIAQCNASITEVLLTPAGVETARSLSVLTPGDTSTNSTVNLAFAFVEANPGLLKLDLSTFKNCVENSSKRYISVLTPDGQSKTSSLADRSSLEGGFSFWVDDRNWFGQIDVEIHEEGGDQEIIGECKLVIIDCFKGGDGEMISSTISMSWDRRMNAPTPNISLRHCFLAAGIVRVKCIDANGVGDAAHPRVVIKAAGRTHMTKKPKLATTSSLLWDNELEIPVVSESSLTIEFGDFDQVTGEFESLGSSDLSLLPLYKSASIDVSVDLKHQSELGEMIDVGKIQLALQFVFQGPTKVAFPRDQGTVQSYIPGDSETITDPTKNDTQGFSEFDIRQAFDKIDLDKNGYIGAAELRHCLVCMGEHVTEAEIDMMISMLDLNGDGQVSFRSFKAMVESPDPANDDFSYLYVPTRAERDQGNNNMQEVFRKHVQAHSITKADVLRAWDALRRSALSSRRGSSTRFDIGYEQLSELMPQFGESSEIFDLLRSDTDNAIDGRQLVMSFASVFAFSSTEKCKLAFDMFDVDGSGYLSIDQIEVLLTCTHFSKRETLKKKAYNLLRLVGEKGTGGVSMKALTLGADKFPSLIFPSTKQQEV
mmetsp:Transcript_21507/g.43151  ORF Transcript_21507/g.43151 Transcript_21507/m.43151 type:complete len:693 (-) Transcript_21507:148-2226(-)